MIVQENHSIKLRPFLIRVFGVLLFFFVLDLAAGKFLETGLEKYYGLYTNAQVALVGHSHLMLGVDKEKLEKGIGISVAKYTREGVNVQDRKIMVEQLVDSNKEVSTLIYGVDAWSFTSEGLSKNSYSQFYPFLYASKIKEFIRNNASKTDYWTKRLIKTSRFDETLLSSAIRGHLGKWTNLKYGTVNIENLQRSIGKEEFRKIKNDAKSIEEFQKTMEIAIENNIEVILLYVPTIDLLQTAQPREFNRTIAIFEKIAAENKGITFLNWQSPWSENYELFYDPIHLNPKGQRVVTDSLITYLKQRNTLSSGKK